MERLAVLLTLAGVSIACEYISVLYTMYVAPTVVQLWSVVELRGGYGQETWKTSVVALITMSLSPQHLLSLQQGPQSLKQQLSRPNHILVLFR